MTTQNEERDARLIAAAPELLMTGKAAFKLLLRLRNREILANAPEIQALGAAIQKATGHE